jgi:DNA-binding LytR/AlgR family response regulator
MEQERPGFEEMEALAMASIFWRCSRQTCADMDNIQSFEVVDTI